MGGWCSKRGQCPHYTEAARINPVERLCMTGRDGTRLIEAAAFRTVLVDVFTGKIEKDKEQQRVQTRESSPIHSQHTKPQQRLRSIPAKKRLKLLWCWAGLCAIAQKP